MSLPKMTTAVDNISKLDTRPNAVNGLTADQLKAEFDKGPEAIKKFLNEVLIPALDGAITLDALGAVPVTRKVARKALSEDILLDASDIDYDGTIDGTRVQGDLGDAIDMISMKLGETVPKTRTVNGKTLDKDITLTAGAIEYAGTASGSDVAAALDGLAAKKAVALVTVTATDDGAAADLTLSQIVDAYNTGREVKCLLVEGSNSTLLSLLKISSTVARFYGQTSATAGRAVTFTQSGSIGVTQVKAGAANVEYSGKVGSDAVADVAEALDGLAVGKPLDMTADYVASGAETVEDWAMMAKVVNGVASAEEYRVEPGRYAILWDQLDTTYVTILPSADGGCGRIIIVVEQQSDDQFVYISASSSGTPGGEATECFYLSNEEHCLQIDGKTLTLPTYDQTSAADEGKILRIVKANGENVYTPEWVTLPTYDGGVS